ncbi:type II toxin-antitoxin system VapC family toxin [Spirosoma luteolum]
MKYLLDTHAVIFAISDPDELSPKVRAIVQDQANKMYISWVTLWEIALLVNVNQIQLNTGRLTLGTYLERVLSVLNISVLPQNMAQVSRFAALPVPNHPTRRKAHTDPFDRGIITCGLVNKLPIITKDIAFRAYENVYTIW